MSCFSGFVLDPLFEVGLTQNLVDHDTLSIERHLGLKVAFFNAFKLSESLRPSSSCIN